MNIQQIVAFDETCRYSSISKAAEALHITPSGLRLSLHRLEDELGTGLIVWGERNFLLTDDGVFFLENARAMRAIYERCTSYFSREQRFEAMNIASCTNFPSILLGSFYHEFHQKNANIFCTTIDYASNQCDNAVYDREAELGVNTGPFDQTRFEYFPLYSFPLVLIINKKNPLSDADSISMADVAAHPLAIVDVKSSDDSLIDTFRRRGLIPHIGARCLRDNVIVQMVKSNPNYIGITQPEAASELLTDDILVRPFPVKDFRKTVYLFHRRSVTLSRSAMQLKKFLLEKTRNFKPTFPFDE